MQVASVVNAVSQGCKSSSVLDCKICKLWMDSRLSQLHLEHDPRYRFGTRFKIASKSEEAAYNAVEQISIFHLETGENIDFNGR